MKQLEAFEVKLYVGLREQYTDIFRSINEVRKIIQEHCNVEGDCVTMTLTEFFYKDGWENGVIIGWINYPRFPREKETMIVIAKKVGEKLMKELKQNRVTITTPTNSIMLENENLK